MKKKTYFCSLVVLSAVALYFFDFSFDWFKLVQAEKRIDLVLGIICFMNFMTMVLIRIIQQSNKSREAYRTVILLLFAFIFISFYDKRIDVFPDFISPLFVIISLITSIVMIVLKKADNNETITDSNESEECVKTRKYRDIFYSLPLCFSSVVNEDEYTEWFDDLGYSDDAETMLCVEFIKRFNIEKEVFDRLNNEYAAIIKAETGCQPCVNPKDYPEQEKNEIFNADILYSFDQVIIRQYYLKPVYEYSDKEEYENACNSSYII